MKRGPAILFMLLATVVILAHSFIPHAHHDDHICLTGKTHQASHSPGHDHSGKTFNTLCTPDDHNGLNGHCHDCGVAGRHSHDSKGETSDCRLINVLVFNPSESKTHSVCSCSGHNTDSGSFTLAPAPPSAVVVSSPENTLPFRQKPYLAFEGRSCMDHPGGTRAPPLS